MVGGTCKACPNGTFGRNCSSQCPADKYGYLCAETCECKYYEMCSATKGCIPGEGYCVKERSTDVGCCPNYWKSKNGSCIACAAGTYGENCSDECPKGFYGLLCGKKCSCETNCDKVVGCPKTAGTRFHGKKLLLWILPFTCGILILFCLAAVFIRRRRGKPTSRSIDDIGHSQNSRIRDASRDAVSQNNTVNNTVNDPERSKPKCTESLARMCSDDENDTGIYNTLSLRSNTYEEPVGRKKSLLVHQTMKPTYKTMEESFSKNCKKSLVSEKRMAKDENQCEYVGDYAANSRIGTENVLFESSSSENQTESPEESINVYNLANFAEHDCSDLPPRSTFLEDLTSKLSNLKKY
uniref:Multiple epidermal growth factor-like domains protein 10 isoform X2 n=1 Tax=Crassostrea virginica TaxID=6565 RepID=A0A8B8B1Z8_CRAVI|nr:multiple epidermal growth factor-like domains protein 10 isoform X2 [Crassostrea virginica]